MRNKNIPHPYNIGHWIAIHVPVRRQLYLKKKENVEAGVTILPLMDEKQTAARNASVAAAEWRVVSEHYFKHRPLPCLCFVSHAAASSR